jgi:hypothetical protein
MMFVSSDYSCSYHRSAVLVFSHDEAVVIRVNKFDLPVTVHTHLAADGLFFYVKRSFLAVSEYRCESASHARGYSCVLSPCHSFFHARWQLRIRILLKSVSDVKG